MFDRYYVICVHPGNNNKLLNKYLSGFLILKYQTTKYIRNSHIVLFQESSPALEAILLKKNLISLETELLGNYLLKRTITYKKILGLFSINLDIPAKFSKRYLEKKMQMSVKKTNAYVNECLNADGSIPGYKKILNEIENIK